LARWATDTLGDGSDVTVELLPGPRATGFSCETILFDAEWMSAGQHRRLELAARVQPSGYTLYRHHDLDRQWRVIEAVGRQGTVPVPRIVGEATASGPYLEQPFFVMERVGGEPCSDAPPYTTRGWLRDAGPKRQRAVVERCVDVLVRIHAIDPDELPSDVMARDVPPGLEAQVREYKDFLEWVADGRHLPKFERAYEWVCRELPDHLDRVFCWGDSRIGNVLFLEDRPTAVLDWEMACLGPPEADVAWWLAFDRIHTEGRSLPRLPGFPSEADIVRRYEAASGRTLRNLRFYLVWATLRAAVLLFRFHDMLVLTGSAPANPERAAHLPALRVMDRLLEEGS
jgi:aminoglycoside phosphotransferase (APT) family kinase protein